MALALEPATARVASAGARVAGSETSIAGGTAARTRAGGSGARGTRAGASARAWRNSAENSIAIRGAAFSELQIELNISAAQTPSTHLARPRSHRASHRAQRLNGDHPCRPRCVRDAPSLPPRRGAFLCSLACAARRRCSLFSQNSSHPGATLAGREHGHPADAVDVGQHPRHRLRRRARHEHDAAAGGAGLQYGGAVGGVRRGAARRERAEAQDPRAPGAQGGEPDEGERRAGGGARRFQPPPLHPQGRRPRPPRQPNTRFQPTAARVAPLRERPPGEADLDVRAAPRGRDGRRRAPGLGHLQAPHHLALVAPRQAALPHPGKRHTHTPPALFRSL